MEQEQNEQHRAVSTLAQMYEKCPPDVRPYLDECFFEFMGQLVPRVAAIVTLGSAMPRKDVEDLSLGQAFNDALQQAEDAGMSIPTHITATVRQIGVELGEHIDKLIPRALLTAQNENYVNRDAHLDIVAGHALVVRGLGGLSTIPADYDGESSE